MTRKVIQKYIPKYINGRTLDMGAGTKKYKSFISKYVSEYLSLDIAGDMDYICSADSIPVRDNYFNSVLCFQMLEHVQNPKKVVTEIYRVLDNDGYAIITVPFLVPEHSDPYDFQRYTERGLCCLFEDNGFEIVEKVKYGTGFDVLIEFLKFKMFNPYTSSKYRKYIGNKFLPVLYYISSKLKTKTGKEASFYCNVMVCARKIV